MGKAVTISGDTNFKARRAAEATLALLGHPGVPFSLEVDCPLPPSKGFGTSTADVVGAVVATAAAVGASLGPSQIARLAVSVEPSDGTMFPGLALFDHRGATRWEVLGQAPPLAIAVLEFDGEVDTMDYNAGLDLPALRALEPEHRRALELLREGLRTGQPELIGRAATVSARANQRLLPKPELERVISLGERFGALGVGVAHSGTAVGVLFEPGHADKARGLLAEAPRSLKGLRGGWVSRMVGGGQRSSC
jgi:L-threonine kinase